MEPIVSVVVAVRNGERTIAKCLSSLQAQDMSGFEIIVVDDGSKDRTVEIVSRFPGVKLLKLPAVGASAARNEGVAAAEGKYVAFIDADCIAAPDWLRKLIEGIEAGGYVGSGGVQKCPEDASEFEKDVHLFLSALGFVSEYYKGDGGGIRECSHNPSCNAIYRTEIFREVGGFPAGMWPCEDLALDRKICRMGGRLSFNPAARVSHYRPCDLKSLLKMMWRYGRGHADLMSMFGPYRFIHILPFAWILAAVGIVLFGLLKGLLPAVKLCFILFVLLALFFAVRTGKIFKACRFAVWFVLCSTMWVVSFWVQMVRRILV